jgi:methylase of polypeptide subunit release factors
MAKKADQRHRYGQHYTPHEVARLLAALAVRKARDLVLDPACGDGRLLGEALLRKISLSQHTGLVGESLARDLFGLDRSASAAKLAARMSARVACADFFDIKPGSAPYLSLKMPSQFDAIIGNPPYIRQEVMGTRDKRRIERCLTLTDDEHGIHWPRWSGRSDIFVYFFAHSARFLRNGGRLVFLTASSWMDVAYGIALREFLLENFRVIAIIESAAESFFSDASVNTAITVLERESEQWARGTNSVRFVRLTKPITEIIERATSADPPIELARSIEQANSPLTSAACQIRTVKQADLLSDLEGGANQSRNQIGQGWNTYLRADEVFFEILERGDARLKRLSDMARVRFGMKTGANDFFYMKGAGEEGGAVDRARRMKRLGDVAVVRRGITTGANEFFYLNVVDGNGKKGGETSLDTPLTTVKDISGVERVIESEYLSPILFSLKEIPGLVVELRHTNKLFFNCSGSASDLAGTLALDYIRGGEAAGYHLRPTCASREPWYWVARDRKPAPLIFPAKVGERWLIALNRARVFEDKKLYGVFPRRGVSAVLLAALLNSIWARYFVEVTCRQLTGAQAIADIDVSVAERIMLPDPRKLPDPIKRKLESAFEALARRPVLSVFEEVERADRRRLDGLALAAIGLDNRSERERMLDRLYKAVTALVRERLVKSRRRDVERMKDEG